MSVIAVKADWNWWLDGFICYIFFECSHNFQGKIQCPLEAKLCISTGIRPPQNEKKIKAAAHGTFPMYGYQVGTGVFKTLSLCCAMFTCVTMCHLWICCVGHCHDPRIHLSKCGSPAAVSWSYCIKPGLMLVLGSKCLPCMKTGIMLLRECL